MFEVENYLFPNSDTVEGHPTHDEYINCPASAFLKFVVSAKDSTEYCKNNFPNYNNNPANLTRESHIITQHIINSTLALLMGHFETYQKYLFAGIFEKTIYLQDFKADHFFNHLGFKQGTLEIKSIHLLGYRGERAVTTGIILADTLKDWHNPEIVNKYMKSLVFQTDFFSNDDKKDLECFWQLRHSIVHTAATLTKPDAQKVQRLNDFAGKNIIFKNNFIYELAERMHSMVKQANERISDAFMQRLGSDCNQQERDSIELFFEVKTPDRKWKNFNFE